MHIKLVLVGILAAVLVASECAAQTTTGVITGTVFDFSGAVLAGATLTLTSVDTGEVRTQATGSLGVFRFDYLPVGQYSLRGEAKGFEELDKTGIKVLTNVTETVDLTLQLGSVKQTVNVSSVAPLVNVESATVGGVVEQQAVVDLPLNGRNFLNLVPLEPGAISTAKLPGGGESFITSIHGGNFSVFGAPAEDTEYLLDGVTVRDNGGTNVMVRPIIDSVEEFNFQASNYSAAFGNVDGGVISITTRGGTNNLHGGAWEFLRNSALDARNYFDVAPLSAPFHQNQFGGSLGGPIKKDKLFFFVAFEGLRSAQDITQAATVPTVAERSGNFSGLSPIFNPETIDPVTGQRMPFPGNQITAINPVAEAALQRLFPLPNFPGATNNLVEPAEQVINSNQLDFRVDWIVTNKDRAFVRYTWFHTDRTLPFQFSSLPNFASVWNSPVHNVVLSEVHTFSGNTVNDFKVGLNRPGQRLEDAQQNVPVDQQLGIGGTSSQFLGNPNINIAGISGTGAISNAPNNRTQNDYSVVDNISHTIGRHTLQWGASNVWHQINGGFNPGAHGVFNFTGVFTGQLTSSGTIQPGTGNPIADFLLGFPFSSSVCCTSSANGFHHWRRWNFGTYLQDDWKVSPRLTLNLGIRYDYFSVARDLNNRFSEPDLSAAPAFVLLLAGQNGVSPGIVRPDVTDFAPRVGFAWSPDSKLVIRGGYSVNFNDINQEYTFDVDTNPPFAVGESFISSTTMPQLTLANAFPAALAGASSAFGAIDPNIRDPYVLHWNLTVERSVGFGTVLSVGYIGNHGNRLILWGDDANAPQAGPGPIAARRPVPAISTVTYTGSGGSSIYHALELQAEKRLTNGFSFLASYVWGKCLDNGATEVIGDGSPAPTPIANPVLNRTFNRGRCQDDVPQRVNGYFIYQPPFGKNLSGLAHALATGWQLQGMVDLQAGQPFSVMLPFDNSNTGELTDRADLIPGQNPNNGPKTSLQWFNVNAFTLPPPFSYGDSGRDIVNGPPYKGFDFSAFKDLLHRETQQLTLRVELFNVLNHPNFFQPGNEFGTPTFGAIKSAFPSREIQFGLKYNF